MPAVKPEYLILAALGLTFKRQREHAEALLNKQGGRTVGTRLIGAYANADAFDFRKLFIRDGLHEITPESPLMGCRYFECPLLPGEGVIGALPLREAFARNLDIFAKPHRQYGWRFVSNALGPLPHATCIRMVLGPPTLEEQDTPPRELIFWHWMPHCPALLERPDIGGGSPILTYADLITCAQKNFDNALVHLGPAHIGLQKVWPSVFTSEIAAGPKSAQYDDDETKELPILPGASLEDIGSETTTVLPPVVIETPHEIEENLKRITKDDSKDPPTTAPLSVEERSLLREE